MGGDGGGVDGVGGGEGEAHGGGGEGEGKAPAHGNHRLGKSQVMWFMLMVMAWLEVRRYQLKWLPMARVEVMTTIGISGDFCLCHKTKATGGGDDF